MKEEQAARQRAPETTDTLWAAGSLRTSVRAESPQLPLTIDGSVGGHRLDHVVRSAVRARSTRQPEPPALVLNEPSCYHFRVFDPPRLPLRGYVH